MMSDSKMSAIKKFEMLMNDKPTYVDKFNIIIMHTVLF